MSGRILLACVLSSSLWAIGGCKENKSSEPPEPKVNQPRLGVPCTVEFRRDSLGYLGDKAVPPLEGGNGTGTFTLSGVIIEANEQWLVLDNVERANVVTPDGKRPTSTVWIRIENVLLISYDKK